MEKKKEENIPVHEVASPHLMLSRSCEEFGHHYLAYPQYGHPMPQQYPQYFYPTHPEVYAQVPYLYDDSTDGYSSDDLIQEIPQLFDVDNYIVFMGKRLKIRMLSNSQMLKAGLACNNYLASVRPDIYKFQLADLFLPPEIDNIRIFISRMRMKNWMQELIDKKIKNGEEALFASNLLATYSNCWVSLPENLNNNNNRTNNTNSQTRIHNLQRQLKPYSQIGEQSCNNSHIKRDSAREHALNGFLNSADVQIQIHSALRSIMKDETRKHKDLLFIPIVLLKIEKIDKEMNAHVKYVHIETAEQYERAVSSHISFLYDLHNHTKDNYTCFWSFPHCMGICYQSLIKGYTIESFENVTSLLRDPIDVTAQNELDRQSIILAKIRAFRQLFFGFLDTKKQSLIYHKTCNALWKMSMGKIDSYAVYLNLFGNSCLSLCQEMIKDNKLEKESEVNSVRMKLLDRFDIEIEDFEHEDYPPLNNTIVNEVENGRKRGNRGGKHNKRLSKRKEDEPIILNQVINSD